MATQNSVVPADLNTKKIKSLSFKQVLRGNEFAPFMGKDANGVIQVDVDTSKGSGTNLAYSLLAAQDADSGFILGDNTLTGNEEALTYYSDKVEIDDVRRGIKVGRQKYSNLATPMKLQEEIKPQLMDVFAEKLGNDIVTSAVVTATPNRTRVLFGASDSNYDATLATALANIDTAADTMTVDMLKIAVNKAKDVASASAGVKSRRIRPFKAEADKMGAQINNFLCFMDAEVASDLTSSDEWKDLRAADRNNELSKHFFTGSEYLGTVHGVMCFEVNRMVNNVKSGAGAASADVHHSILVGAQAFGLAYGETGTFAEGDETDFGMNVSIGYHQIYGVKMLSFNSVEQGVVHIFSAVSA